VKGVEVRAGQHMIAVESGLGIAAMQGGYPQAAFHRMHFVVPVHVTVVRHVFSPFRGKQGEPVNPAPGLPYHRTRCPAIGLKSLIPPLKHGLFSVLLTADPRGVL